MDADSDIAEKINELLGVVAALKAYVAHLPGAAEVDLDAVRRAGRDTGSGLIGGVHPSTHVSEAVADIQRMPLALKPPTDWTPLDSPRGHSWRRLLLEDPLFVPQKVRSLQSRSARAHVLVSRHVMIWGRILKMTLIQQ